MKESSIQEISSQMISDTAIVWCSYFFPRYWPPPVAPSLVYQRGSNLSLKKNYLYKDFDWIWSCGYLRGKYLRK